jgi:transposase
VATRWQLAGDLVADVRNIDRRVAAAEDRITAAVPTARPAWWSCSGSGRCWPPGSWVRSATFVGSRPSTTFAAHTGTAPREASRGQVVRHRLSRAGDRKLNHALYLVAMVQVRRPSAGQAYYQRKLAEGKSPKEALR